MPPDCSPCTMQDDDADLGSLLRTNSLPSAGNVREVVFEQLSPRGMHVRMRITHPQHSLEPDFVLGPPPPPRRPKKPAESAPVHAKPIAGAESPTAAAEQRLRAHHSEAASCQPQESTARPTRPQADGVAQERKAGKTAGFGAVELHADCRQTVAASALEEVPWSSRPMMDGRSLALISLMQADVIQSLLSSASAASHWLAHSAMQQGILCHSSDGISWQIALPAVAAQPPLLTRGSLCCTGRCARVPGQGGTAARP